MALSYAPSRSREVLGRTLADHQILFRGSAGHGEFAGEPDSRAISVARIAARRFDRRAISSTCRHHQKGASTMAPSASLARNGSEFVGYVWLKLRGYEEDEVRCRYVPIPELNTAWDFDVYIAPSYRMSRMFIRVWDAVNDFLRNNRIDWTLSRISAFNADSLRSHRRMGIHRIATGLFLCAGTMQIAFVSVRPFVHVSLGEKIEAGAATEGSWRALSTSPDRRRRLSRHRTDIAAKPRRAQSWRRRAVFLAAWCRRDSGRATLRRWRWPDFFGT